MKKNECARCGKSERFGRVFESVSHKDTKFFLCVDCAQILYKAEDARKEGDHEIETQLRDSFQKGIRDGALKSILSDWLNDKQ
ncbi:MAG: hypothetical protein LBS51_02030 [Oscillospiraceae bacterium]|jgi:hypothetical protein|nr:hypothetical protein [Oscillospiraceae bacterium]